MTKPGGLAVALGACALGAFLAWIAGGSAGAPADDGPDLQLEALRDIGERLRSIEELLAAGPPAAPAPALAAPSRLEPSHDADLAATLAALRALLEAQQEAVAPPPAGAQPRGAGSTLGEQQLEDLRYLLADVPIDQRGEIRDWPHPEVVGLAPLQVRNRLGAPSKIFKSNDVVTWFYFETQDGGSWTSIGFIDGTAALVNRRVR